jgi:hypothetical protein
VSNEFYFDISDINRSGAQAYHGKKVQAARRGAVLKFVRPLAAEWFVTWSTRPRQQQQQQQQLCPHRGLSFLPWWRRGLWLLTN